AVADHCFTFDELLPYMGEFGFYQKRLVLYIFPFTFLWAFVYFTQIFVIIMPEHWCQIPELQDLPKHEQLHLGIPKKDDDSFEKCVMYDTNFTYVLESNLTEANDSWPQKTCDVWVYDKELVPYDSIATENNWVCSQDDLGPYTVTVFFLGALVGNIVFGFMADHWGRIPAAMLSNLCGLIGGVTSAFSTSFLSFSVCRFVAGMAFDNCSYPAYILVMEYVGPKYRAFVTNLILTGFFMPAACLLPWIAYWCRDWRLLTLVTSLPIIVSLLMYFFLQESARWLVTVGKLEKAISIIKYVAKTNGKTIPDDVLLSFQHCCILLYVDKPKSQYTSWDLFKRWKMCRITVLLIVLWMITALVYDAHVRAIIEIGPDVFITFSVAAFMEFPSCLVPMFFLDITGRKCMTFMAFIGCAAGSLIASQLTVKWHIAVSATFGRFCATIAFNVGNQWAAEAFPTVLRGQGIALKNIMGSVATLLSPFVVYAAKYSVALPMLILGTLSVVAAFLSLLLPETTRRDLPQTPEDIDILW
ncbi:hypothetical protein KR222_003811, partial [Zaprionus bogoriensis]